MSLAYTMYCPYVETSSKVACPLSFRYHALPAQRLYTPIRRLPCTCTQADIGVTDAFAECVRELVASRQRAAQDEARKGKKKGKGRCVSNTSAAFVNVGFVWVACEYLVLLPSCVHACKCQHATERAKFNWTARSQKSGVLRDT